MKVCAATIAYNNSKELTRLLSSLANQGAALTGLIVIDNSDDFCIAANRKAFDTHATRYSFSCYRKTKRNTGSAGGFRSGMKIAHENDFDYVWLLDQDGIASDLCLTELLKRASDADILCPKTVDIENPSVVFARTTSKKNFFGHLAPFRSNADTQLVDTFATHGAFISKKVIGSIGYYDACNFHVGFEDYDYAWRARRAKFTILHVNTAQVQHPDLKRKKAIREIQLGGRPRREINPVAIDRLRPEFLGYVTEPSRSERGCDNGRALLPFSWLYFLTKSLQRWQFSIAFVYSLCLLFIKSASEKDICLKETLNAYVKCLASNAKKEWPYACVEEFYRCILD